MTDRKFCADIGHQWQAHADLIAVDVPRGSFRAADAWLTPIEDQPMIQLNLSVKCEHCPARLNGTLFTMLTLARDTKHPRRLIARTDR